MADDSSSLFKGCQPVCRFHMALASLFPWILHCSAFYSPVASLLEDRRGRQRQEISHLFVFVIISILVNVEWGKRLVLCVILPGTARTSHSLHWKCQHTEALGGTTSSCGLAFSYFSLHHSNKHSFGIWRWRVVAHCIIWPHQRKMKYVFNPALVSEDDCGWGEVRRGHQPHLSIGSHR